MRGLCCSVCSQHMLLLYFHKGIHLCIFVSPLSVEYLHMSRSEISNSTSASLIIHPVHYTFSCSFKSTQIVSKDSSLLKHACSIQSKFQWNTVLMHELISRERCFRLGLMLEILWMWLSLSLASFFFFK